MGRFASALFAATVGCAVANGAAPINARLIGLFRAPGDPRSCSLLSINPNDGSNVTISEVYACINTTQTFPAFSAYDSASNSIRVVIATAPAIVAYDINTGSEVAQWQLPTYNASNPFLGLVTTGPLTAATTYLVTQFVIYKLAGTGLQPVVNVALPELAQVAATPAGIIYIADEAGATLYSIDMANGGILQKVTSGFSKPWDLQYSLALSSLVELGSYQLYVTNPTTVSKACHCERLRELCGKLGT